MATILVAEDNEMNLEVLSRALTRAGRAPTWTTPIASRGCPGARTPSLVRRLTRRQYS